MLEGEHRSLQRWEDRTQTGPGKGGTIPVLAVTLGQPLNPPRLALSTCKARAAGAPSFVSSPAQDVCDPSTALAHRNVGLSRTCGPSTTPSPRVAETSEKACVFKTPGAGREALQLIKMAPGFPHYLIHRT